MWECKIPIKGTYTSHPGIINNFCDCILKGAKPIAPGAEGIRGLQISNAIHLSSWLNGEWVNIPVDGELFLENCRSIARNRSQNNSCPQQKPKAEETE